ncbi:MAG: amino acid permease [Candidatus Wallbacteria bacterium]
MADITYKHFFIEGVSDIFSKIFRTKSVDKILKASQAGSEHFVKSLNWVDLIFMGIGAIIGAGIFTTIGTAAAGDACRPGAGPSLMVSFLLTAIACGFSAMCYAEFSAMVPIAGSAYTYSYATLGELVAWIIGWDLVVEYSIGCIAVSISWSGYFTALLAGFGLKMPLWLTIDPKTAHVRDAILNNLNSASISLHGLFSSFGLSGHASWMNHAQTEIANNLIIPGAPVLFGVPFIFNLPAVSIITLLTLLIIVGVKESARFNEVMVAIKLLVLSFFCIVGFFYINPANYVPFAPNGWGGIQAGAAIVFLAFIGFDAVSTLAEETQNPARDLPIGIIGSLLVCTIIYIVVTAVFTGLIPYSSLSAKLASEKAEPLAMAFKHIAEVPGASELTKKIVQSSAGIVALGSLVAQTAVILVLQLGLPRIVFSMSRDGLLPSVFMKIHHRFKTPYVSTIILWVFMAFFAACMNLDEMVDLCNIGTLFAFMLVCLSIIVLRFKDPNRPRPFKIPGGIIIPILGCASCLYLTLGLPATSWIRFIVWLLIGAVFYFSYGIRKSKLNPENADCEEIAADVPHDIDKF